MLNSEITTLCNCCQIKLTNGQQLGFTDHQQNLEINGLIYQANGVFSSSAISKSTGLNADNLQLNNIIDHQTITYEDIQSGIYDQAEIELFQVDYNNLKQERKSIYSGYIASLTRENNKIYAELKSQEIKTDQNIIELYSPYCRANLGDKRCKVNLDNYSFKCQIVQIFDNRQIQISLDQQLPEGYFDFGYLQTEQGQKLEIFKHYRQFITLRFPLKTKLQQGDFCQISAGCSKELNCCTQKFNNALNFRGEPHLPGMEKILSAAISYE